MTDENEAKTLKENENWHEYDTVVVRGKYEDEKTCVTVGTEPLKVGELQVRSICQGDREGGHLRKW